MTPTSIIVIVMIFFVSDNAHDFDPILSHFTTGTYVFLINVLLDLTRAGGTRPNAVRICCSIWQGVLAWPSSINLTFFKLHFWRFTLGFGGTSHD